MPLEEAEELLKNWRDQYAMNIRPWCAPDKAHEALKLVLHHHEAVKRECSCETFTEVYVIRDVIWLDDETGERKIGYGNPAIHFCPWCGGSLPAIFTTTKEGSGG